MTTGTDADETDLSFEFEDEDFSCDEEDESKIDFASAVDQRPNAFSNKPLLHYTYESYPISSFIEENFIAKAQTLKAQFLAELLVDEVLVILQYKNWLQLEVLGEYYDNWPKFRAACGLPAERGTYDPIRKLKNFLCSICCEIDDLDVFSLLCMHEYCLSCYRRYVENAVCHAGLVRCMEPLCLLTLLHSDILLLTSFGRLEGADLTQTEILEEVEQKVSGLELEDKPLQSESPFRVTADLYFNVCDFSSSLSQDKLSLLLDNAKQLSNSPALVQSARSLIDSKYHSYGWCPAPDCPGLVKLQKSDSDITVNFLENNNLSLIPIASCFKSHEFCFNCRFENHLPSPCWLATKWIAKCSDDSETLNWLQAHTNSCPECQTVIEKNGGCNHIVCRKCKYEFCWICFGPWSEHKSSFWHCNRYDPKEVEATEKNKKKHKHTLSRYLHFYQRFAAHQMSMSGDYQTLNAIQAHMLNYMKHKSNENDPKLSWNDIQFLADSFKGLCAGRKALMWSYAFAFFLQVNNFSTIFESMQDFLNDTVEKLSQIFEQLKMMQPSKDSKQLIAEKREKFIDLTALVLQRRRMLIECADSGLASGDLLLTPV